MMAMYLCRISKKLFEAENGDHSPHEYSLLLSPKNVFSVLTLSWSSYLLRKSSLAVFLAPFVPESFCITIETISWMFSGFAHRKISISSEGINVVMVK